MVNTQAKQPITVPLEYREVSFSPLGFGVAVALQPGVFKKEPAGVGTDIRRGRLRLSSAEADSLPFLWDCAHGKLYLDLNRNGDLTDDPAGTFSSADASPPPRTEFRSARFRGVPVAARIGAGQVPCLVDLTFTDYHTQLTVYLAVRSFWAGKASLDGREWEIGWLPYPEAQPSVAAGDYLLLRDWTERENSFGISDGSLDAFPFPAKVSLGSTLFEIACAHSRDGERLTHQITLTEKTTQTGELIISGRSIKRLLLMDGPCVAVIDSPQATVRVPAGQYGRHRVQLGRGESLAYLQQSPNPGVIVSSSHPATLQAGGPLTNSARLSHRGNELRLDYQLLGAGGGLYTLAARDYQHPPHFTAYKASREIGSGKFEFG